MHVVQVAACSDTGTSRPANEDHYCVGPFIGQGTRLELNVTFDHDPFRDNGLLVAVADGMGGYEGGKDASRLALEALASSYYDAKLAHPTHEYAAMMIRKSTESTARVLESVLGRNPHLSNAGTTVAGLVLLASGDLVAFWLGDSRILRVAGGHGKLLTSDHTAAAQALAAGQQLDHPIPQEALALERSLGARGEREPEISQTTTSWAPGDRFALFTDGVSGLGSGLTSDQIVSVLDDQDTAYASVRALVGQAVRESGRDNATAIVVRFSEEVQGERAATGL